MTGQVEDLVSVVIVTYHSARTIERCIRSVLDSTADLEVILVDNASADGTVELLKTISSESPRVSVLLNADNPGFATGCNQGARLARGSLVLFLNPDAFVDPDAIAALSRQMKLDASIGLMGCLVVDEVGARHGPQRRREPTWRRSLMSASGLARLERVWPWLQGVEVPTWSDPTNHPAESIEYVDGVNGAAMMSRRSALLEVGGFDEDFTLHAEDLDLCRRMRDSRWHVALATDVRVVHIGGVSSRQHRYWVEWQKSRSLWRYFRKHEPGAPVYVRLIVLAGLALRAGARALLISGKWLLDRL